MQSVIVPLVKDKSGDLSDVNNYRAIAISTSMSKLYESIVASEVGYHDDADKYQFGLKKNVIRQVCVQMFLRKRLIITLIGAAMFLLALLILLKRLIGLTIGKCLTNC